MIRIAKIILFRGNKVLLHLRDKEKNIDYPNTWSLIGGYLEEGETHSDGIKREVKEEISLDLNNVSLFSSIVKKEKGDIFQENIFYAPLEVSISKLKLSEGRKIELFSLDDLNSINIRPVFKRAILEFFRLKDN